MRVIIAGSRNFNDKEFLYKHCNEVLSNYTEEIIIINGGANGADKLGEQYAKELNLKSEVFPADWNTHGKSAGPIRNKLMAENADMLIAFYDNKSKGTKNMIQVATKNKLIVYIFDVMTNVVTF